MDKIRYEDTRIGPLLDLIYPTGYARFSKAGDGKGWINHMEENRNKILSIGVESKVPGVWKPRHGVSELPYMIQDIEWQWYLVDDDPNSIVNFSLARSNVARSRFPGGRLIRGCKARFCVECPACGKWCSVGKFMLHAVIHKSK
jgi:hypothetical protein